MINLFGISSVENFHFRRSVMSKNSLKSRDEKLRKRALKMLDSGMSSAEVGKKLGVRTMTVAAWRAHRTMGTYDSE